jgi:hypothetical protein
MMTRKLAVWAGARERAVFFLANALYTPPNPDGTRKQCQNCVMWVASDQQCFIHDADVVVPPDAVCGYHVYGTPQPGGLPGELVRENLQPVTPELSGLIQVPGGTSCDTCHYYTPAGRLSGLCQALHDPETPEEPAAVAALGCCARWEHE